MTGSMPKRLSEGWNRVTAAKGGVMPENKPETSHWPLSDRVLADIAIVSEVLEVHGIHSFTVAQTVVRSLYEEGRLHE